MERKFGCIPSPIDVRDYKIARVAKPIDFPEEFDLGVVRIKDQGNRSTCAAHAGSECVEYHNKKQQGNDTEFSTDFIYGIREDGYYVGEGMYLRDVLKTLNHYGDCTHKLLPSNSTCTVAIQKVMEKEEKLKKDAYPNRISAYYSVSTREDIKQALMQDGPVLVGMKWHWSGALDENNVYTYDKEQSTCWGGHAVLIVGWKKDCFIIQNSWGEKWGDKGRFLMRMEDAIDGGVIYEKYGITDDITNVKTPNKVLEFLAKLINWIINAIKDRVTPPDTPDKEDIDVYTTWNYPFNLTETDTMIKQKDLLDGGEEDAIIGDHIKSANGLEFVIESVKDGYFLISKFVKGNS